VVTYLKELIQFQSSKRYKKTLYNGQWIEPDTYQVVVGYGIAEILNGIAGFQ
jgi:lipoprotein-releasing system permease protein